MPELVLRNFPARVLAKLNLDPQARERIRRQLAGMQVRPSAGPAGEGGPEASVARGPSPADGL